MANYWEEQQRKDRDVIRQILQEQGVKSTDITLIERWCVFPYKGFWIALTIDSGLAAEIFYFPTGEEGDRLKELLRSPLWERDPNRYIKLAKFREGYQTKQEGGRHKIILQILQYAGGLTPKRKTVRST